MALTRKFYGNFGNKIINFGEMPPFLNQMCATACGAISLMAIVGIKRDAWDFHAPDAQRSAIGR